MHMLKTKLRRVFSTRVSSLFAVFILVASFILMSATPVFALPAINTASATLSTNAPGPATATYTLSFKLGATDTIGSISAQACDQASGSCTQSGNASGFSGSSDVFGSTTLPGSSWATTTNATALKAHNASGAAGNTSTQYNISWTGVTNPTAPNATWFLQVTLYSDTGFATPVETGVMAISTAGQITVTATVNQSLTFTLATATAGLGVLSTATTSSATSTMSAATNALNGYVITVNGSTLAGPSTITALTSATPASVNTPQFGLNLVANTTPSVGSNVSGSGSGTAASGYNTANSYKFVTGNTVASAGGATNSNTFTVSYIADIDSSIAPGSYSTVLTYICTPTF